MTNDRQDDFSFLSGPAATVAPRLLGCVLERQLDGETVRVKIVETEAYDQADAASHSYRGETLRTAPMFGAAGFAYVYFTYGMHHCMNVVVGEAGHGAAVLIRAVEPLDEYMAIKNRRQNIDWKNTTNGPGKLCQALGIDRRLSGHDLRSEPLRLIVNAPVKSDDIVMATRIGISKAKDELWRFYLHGNEWVSKPR